MITREKLVKCAEAVVNGMNLKHGEAVLISGGIHAQEFLEEIGLLCYKSGAIPMISATSDSYKARTFEELPKEILATTPKHLLAAVKEVDAYITVEPYRDPAVMTRAPLEKISASQEGRTPIRKVLYGEETGRGKNVCGGSVHVAFGNNHGYGGRSKSSMHWDFVTHPSATIEIVETGDVVMKDGKIV